ncbi:MAG: hypothetical protein PQJ60_02135 [Spirochaetales bacterium]|nr:hypothetical protein [Spirochaetales bacterium]
MRIREKRSITILESIPCFQSITLSQLSMDTGFSLPQVESLVKGLAAKPSLGIVLNGHSVSRATEIPPKPGKRPKPETGSFKRSVKKDRSLGKDRVKITTSATLNGKEIDPDDLPDEIKKMLGKTDFSNFRGDNFTGETVTMQTSTFSMNINGREINGEELTPELKAQIDDPALSLMEKARILEEHFGDKK